MAADDATSSASPATQSQRAASFLVSESFVNEQLKLHSNTVGSPVLESKITFDAKTGQILLRGLVQIPTEELRAVNLDPKLGKFRFQIALKPQTTPKGHLILEFPINETYFYPANSDNIKNDRVIIPVQMLSLALASARGYLAALSGDFGTFDRQTTKLEAMIKGLDHLIATEKNEDAVSDLKNQRESLKLKLAAVPIERKQLEGLSKEYEAMVGFTGEKELSLNDGLAARKNALVLKIKLSQLAPYLSGIELGGVRMVHDKKDGNGENYLAIDINSDIDAHVPVQTLVKHGNRVGMAVAPSIIVRLNQALFESDSVLDAEKKNMSSQLKDFDLQLKEDGLHIAGKWKTFLISIPFDTIVDFNSTGVDSFEARVGEIKVAGIDLDFLNKFILESLKKRLDVTMKGICTFNYVDGEKGKSGSLQVVVDPKKLVPAFPDLHLVDVDVRDKEFLLKIGHVQKEAAK